MEIPVSDVQQRFLRSSAPIRGFVGGRGSGKTWIGALDIILRAMEEPGLYAVYAPTYPMLRDLAWRAVLEHGKRLRCIASHSRSDHVLVLGSGAEIIGRSMDDPDKARGPNLRGAWMDEASLMKHEAYLVTIASLRAEGKRGWLSATFTPKGRAHWTYSVFGSGAPDVETFHAATSDNPFLPPHFEESIRSHYTAQFAAQELGGEFVDMEGSLARREWFKIVDAAPAGGKRVRAWDLAATERDVSHGDPDYTVGTLMIREGGKYYIAHVVRERVGPGGVESLILQTARMDGYETHIVLEQEPGASGKLLANSIIRMLSGWSVRAVSVSSDKITRSLPLLAQSEAGNVYLVRGRWNAEWLDEVAAFPVGMHDDQVDSASLAFTALAGWGPLAEVI